LQARALSAFDTLGTERLRPVYESLEGQVCYDDLHLLRLLYLMRRGR
jgi:hypothetical protein